MMNDTHAFILARFLRENGLSKVRAAQILGLSDPRNAGRVTITRWINGEPCQIPFPVLRAALEHIQARMSGDTPDTG